MNRVDRTSDGEQCSNWQDVDSYGIRSDYYTVYKNFYDPMYSELFDLLDDPSTEGRA